jgi:hypothetical protein
MSPKEKLVTRERTAGCKQYRFCWISAGEEIRGYWLRLTPKITPEYLQDALKYLIEHVCTDYWVEYR